MKCINNVLCQCPHHLIIYMYIHKILEMPDREIFVLGEGYKRQAGAGTHWVEMR